MSKKSALALASRYVVVVQEPGDVSRRLYLLRWRCDRGLPSLQVNQDSRALDQH
jgi:hypothetical protein